MFKNLHLAFLLPVFLGGCLLSFSAWSEPAKKNSPYYPDKIPRLSALVDEVLKNHPIIQAVEAQRDAVNAKALAANQPLYNPELEIDIENTDIQTSSIGFSQTIDWSDKKGARSQAAQFEKNRFTAKLQTARQTLTAELLQTLTNYHTDNALDALTRQRIELLQGFVELSEKRRQSGDLNQAELSLAQLAFADAKIQRVRAASQLIETQQNLISLVGNDNNHWPVLPETLPEIKLEEENVEEIIMQLPVLQEQLSRISAAKSQLKLRSREQRADPTIGLRGGREDSDKLIGINLSIPLYVRNNFRAELDVANAELIQAERNSHNIARQSRSKLISSARRYQLVQQTWQGWQQSGQASLNKQINLIQQLWQAGEISTTEYFLQLNQMLDMRQSGIKLRQELWRNWIDWLQASNRLHIWLGLSQ